MLDSDWERFDVKVEKGERGCLLWTGAKTSTNGYGQLWVDGRLQLAHRLAYERRYGSIPDGLVIDHICRVRSCVNPEHLRAVSDKENTLAGVGPAAVNARKTHCSNGHEYTEENTTLRSNGRRECRICKQEQDRLYRQKHKAEIRKYQRATAHKYLARKVAYLRAWRSKQRALAAPDTTEPEPHS